MSHSTVDGLRAKLFSQRALPASLMSYFSVDSISSAALKGRAIVTHNGVRRDGGVWKCSKDRNSSSCFHINESRKLLPEEFDDYIQNLGDCDLATSTDVFNLCEFLCHDSELVTHPSDSTRPRNDSFISAGPSS